MSIIYDVADMFECEGYASLRRYLLFAGSTNTCLKNNPWKLVTWIIAQILQTSKDVLNWIIFLSFASASSSETSAHPRLFEGQRVEAEQFNGLLKDNLSKQACANWSDNGTLFYHFKWIFLVLSRGLICMVFLWLFSKIRL